MDNAVNLFNRRSAKNRQQVAMYSKFIFNGHFIVFLTIAFGALMLQYSQMLKHLPSGINYHFIIALALSLLAIPPLRTFFKEADKVFLLSYEHELDSYIHRAIIQSFIKRIVLWIILFVILLPLYFAGHYSTVGWLTAMIFGVAGIGLGLIIRWFAMKIGLSNQTINILLFLMMLAGLYNALEGVYYTAITEIVFMAGLLYLLKNIGSKAVYPWDTLIEYEEDLTQRQFKLINMFTDVKGLKDNVRRRRYLDIFLRQKSSDYNHNGMFIYLFKRNFVRSKDALWIIIRLVVIGAVVIWFVHQPIVAMIIGVFVVYIIILQASQFYKQQAFQLWPQVWPVEENDVINGFSKFLWQLSLIVTVTMTVIYSIFYLPTFFYAVLFFGVMFWTHQQVMSKLKKKMTLLRD